MRIVLLCTVLITCLSFILGCNNELPINERPMYGGIPRTSYQNEIDEQFIKAVIEQFGSREAAADKHIEFAWAYYDKGDFKTAMKRFNQAWLLDPDKAEIFFGFGVLLSESKKYRESKKMYDKAIEIDPKYSKAYHNRGLDHCRTGDFDLATLDFYKVIELEPDNGQVYNDRAVIFFEKKEYSKCWDDIHKAESLNYKVHPGFLKELKKVSGRDK